MTIEDIKTKASIFLEKHAQNYVRGIDAIRDDLIGMKIFDTPIFSVGSAFDPLFEELKTEGVVEAAYKLPHEWNENANSVISYFLPYTDRIKRANASDMSKPIDEWYHGRIEGQEMIGLLGIYIQELLENENHISVIPSSDERFELIHKYHANWSERHTGYICGIGTFSLSKAMITKVGAAGRLGSVITSAKLSISERDYSDLYEYCSLCGICIANCPASCIYDTSDLHLAKDHKLCDDYCETTNKTFICGGKEKLRYGCGKCEVAVPCENQRTYR